MTDLRPEIFVGIVGAVGSPVAEVSRSLEQSFKIVGYTPNLIRLSKLLEDSEYNLNKGSSSLLKEDKRISNAMDTGDRLRTVNNRSDAVVVLGIKRITKLREASSETNTKAYIFHSLKTPEEIETLRSIYRENFLLVSVYSSKENRLEVLKRKIGDSQENLDYNQYQEIAEDLVKRDRESAEPLRDLLSKEVLGQNVEGAFPLGDFFINCDGKETIQSQIDRFIQILFNHPNRTPTVDEYVMFHAKAAALRSADLSRQVGAVISSDYGEIISAGCNEVPTSGGGSVWEGAENLHEDENRDFFIGYDPTIKMKDEILLEAFKKIPDEWLSDSIRSKKRQQLVDMALYSGKNPPLKGSKIASILEFGRIVHAEMAAITDSARRGVSVKDSTLYCTTFPCHMCARHIISAGIKRVVYVEPYPKSRAKELYPKNIRVDADKNSDSNAVVFEPFVGVGPRRFVELFEMPVRKNKRGNALKWEPTIAVPSFDPSSLSVLLEEFFLEETQKILEYKNQSGRDKNVE